MPWGLVACCWNRLLERLLRSWVGLFVGQIRGLYRGHVEGRWQLLRWASQWAVTSLYPRATPPGRPFGSGHTAVSRPAPAWSRRSMLTATCRIFRRPQRPKDDAVVKCPCRYRRLSGPLRFPRYHVHPKRRQSLLARVPGLSWCLPVHVLGKR